MQRAASKLLEAAELQLSNPAQAERIRKSVQDLFPELAGIIPSVLAVADMNGRDAFLSKQEARVGAPVGTEPLPASSADADLPAYLKLPFRDAIASIASRRPQLVEASSDVEDVYRKYGFTVARSTSIDFVKQVQRKIARSMLDGTDGLKQLRDDFEQEGLGRGYAETVYRTNVKTATSAGRQVQAMHPDTDIIAWLYVAIGDTDTRSNHMIMNGFMASVRNPIWQIWTPPNGFNCFLPGTQVEGRFVAGSKAFYSGAAIEINTARGYRLRVTPNHPILTDQGWLPAKTLREGDNLFSHARQVNGVNRAADSSVSTPLVLRRNIDDQQAPALIEDVFETMAAQGVGPRLASSTPLDFHGDAGGFQGQVHVVRADGVLPDEGRALTTHEGYDLGFQFDERLPLATLQRLSPSLALRRRNFTPSGSVPRSSALTLDRFGISFDLSPLYDLGLGSSPNWDAAPLKTLFENTSSHARFVRELLQAFAGQILSDKIVKVRDFDFTGHVFDLQSDVGYMVSNGVVCSNCRCGQEEITIDEARRLGRLRRDGTFVDDKDRGVMPDPGFTNSPASYVGYRR